MRVFVPTRSQKKNEGNTPNPPDKRAKSPLPPPFGPFVQPLPAQLQKKNILESTLEPKSTAPVLLAFVSISTPTDQPRPPQPLVVISSFQPPLEPLGVWQALRAAIPESLEIMRENKQVLTWIEYRSPSLGWVSTDPVRAARDRLEQLVADVAALEPDALCVAIRGAVSLHPDISPAWQGARQGVSQLARFSRKAINA